MRGKRRFEPMAYLRRRPTLLLVVRVLLLGGSAALIAGAGLIQGWVDIRPGGCPYGSPPGCDDNIHFADRPIAFTIIVGLWIAWGLFCTILSIVAYLKQRGILAQDWKMFGLKVRR
jgi:hypothetical protein